MIIPDSQVQGGIAAVVNGYKGSELEKKYKIIYVESYKDGTKLAKFMKGIVGYLTFLKVLIVNRPDIVHVHSSFGSSFYRKMVFIYMASWAKKPIINHIHGADFDQFYSNASARKRLRIKKVYNLCSKFIVLSEEWKLKISQIVNSSKIEVVENFSVLCEEALLQRVNRSSNKIVLFLGEIGKRKGCYDIPEVIKQVTREIPDVKFVFGGTGDVQGIKKILLDLDIERNTSFVGWVRGKEKEKLLKQADIFFLPSYHEGMPMAILDAMGYGLPVISTNVGGIPKLVHAGENGFIFEPGDIKSYSEAITNLFHNDEKLKTYSKRSFALVKDQYSLNNSLSKLYKIYNRIGVKYDK